MRFKVAYVKSNSTHQGSVWQIKHRLKQMSPVNYSAHLLEVQASASTH